jgi:hypothetical protein
VSLSEELTAYAATPTSREGDTYVKATLTYHSIDDSGSPISVSSGVFSAHLRWLANPKVRVLSLDALASHPDDAEDAVAVNDDGF